MTYNLGETVAVEMDFPTGEIGAQSFTYVIDVLIPEHLWKTKDQWIAQQDKSIKDWNEMTESQQEALVAIVDRSLARARDTIDTWIPSALILEQGQALDITFKLIYTDLEHEVLAGDQITARRVAQTRDEINEFLGNSEE